MKIVIASDLHGSACAVEQLDKRIQEEQPDLIFLLGDILYHGPRNKLPNEYDTQRCADVLNKYADKICAVKGNYDAEVDQWVLNFTLENRMTCLQDDNTGLSFVLSHGHHVGLIPGEPLESLPKPCVFLTGHTHKKVLRQEKDILYVNPGSTSIPKDGTPSYAVFENITCYLKTLDGTVLDWKKFEF